MMRMDVWVYQDENGNISVFRTKTLAFDFICKDKSRKVIERKSGEIVFVNTFGGRIETKIGMEQEQSYLTRATVLTK